MLVFRSCLGVFAISVALIASPAHAVSKTGSACQKIGRTSVVQGKIFVCAKVGKNLRWILKPKALTPSRATVPITTFPSVPVVESDQIAPRTLPVYRVIDGKLERLSGSKYFTADSRTDKDFSPVRVNVFHALSARTPDSVHPNVALHFRISDSFPTGLAEYCRSEIEKAASLWSSVFTSRVEVKVIFATEKDVSWIAKEPFMFSDSVANLERLGRLNPLTERTWITGGGHIWNQGGMPTGTLFLGTASFAKTDFMVDQWPQTPAHEFGHIVQDYMKYPMQPGNEYGYHEAFPLNLVEGSARTLGFFSLPELGWASDAADYNNWQAFKRALQWHQIRDEADMVDLLAITEFRRSDEAFDLSYTTGQLLYEWFISEYGLQKFLALMRETRNHAIFDDSVRAVIGISKTDMYKAASKYLYDTYLRISGF